MMMAVASKKMKKIVMVAALVFAGGAFTYQALADADILQDKVMRLSQALRPAYVVESCTKGARGFTISGLRNQPIRGVQILQKDAKGRVIDYSDSAQIDNVFPKNGRIVVSVEPGGNVGKGLDLTQSFVVKVTHYDGTVVMNKILNLGSQK